MCSSLRFSASPLHARRPLPLAASGGCHCVTLDRPRFEIDYPGIFKGIIASGMATFQVDNYISIFIVASFLSWICYSFAKVGQKYFLKGVVLQRAARGSYYII